MKNQSERANRWRRFSKTVINHIEKYTVPQYGDWPNDQLCEFEIKDIIREMKRYINRAETSCRGYDEQLRDCLKLAHYACELWYSKKENNGDMI